MGGGQIIALRGFRRDSLNGPAAVPRPAPPPRRLNGPAAVPRPAPPPRRLNGPAAVPRPAPPPRRLSRVSFDGASLKSFLLPCCAHSAQDGRDNPPFPITPLPRPTPLPQCRPGPINDGK